MSQNTKNQGETHPMARYMLNTKTGTVTTVAADDDATYLSLREAEGAPGYATYVELRPDDPRVTAHSGEAILASADVAAVGGVLTSQNSWAQALLGPTAGGQSVQPAIVSGAQLFNGHKDPAVYYGINLGINGQPVVAGVPGMAWGLETNYDDASGHIKSEAYMQWADGTVTLRPFFAQIDTVSESVSAVRIASTGGVSFTLDNGSSPYINFLPNSTTFVGSSGTNQVVLGSDGTHGCTLQLAFGATANAAQIHTSAATSLQFIVNGGANAVTLTAVNGGIALAVNSVSNQAAGVFVSPQTTTKCIAAKPIASQTANIFESQDSGGSAHIFITPAQSLVVGNAALATSATDGFLYIPTCAGAPTGTPTAHAGTVALVFDTTDNKLYAYNGAWKSVALS